MTTLQFNNIGKSSPLQLPSSNKEPSLLLQSPTLPLQIELTFALNGSSNQVIQNRCLSIQFNRSPYDDRLQRNGLRTRHITITIVATDHHHNPPPESILCHLDHHHQHHYFIDRDPPTPLHNLHQLSVVNHSNHPQYPSNPILFSSILYQPNQRPRARRGRFAVGNSQWSDLTLTYWIEHVGQ